MTTPKLPPPPRSAQNRSGCSASLAVTSSPVRGDHLGRDQVVARQPVAAGEVADPAAEGEPADAGRGDDPAGRRQPVRAGGVVEAAPGHAAAGPGGPRRRVHRHRGQPGQVRDQRAVRRTETRDAVPAAAHGQLRAGFPRVPHHSGHVGRAGAPHDGGRATVDHEVVDLPGLVVAGVRRGDHRTGQLGPKGFDRLRRHDSSPSPRPHIDVGRRPGLDAKNPTLEPDPFARMTEPALTSGGTANGQIGSSTRRAAVKCSRLVHSVNPPVRSEKPRFRRQPSCARRTWE